MISKMEKFINFKQLRAVRVALADTPTGVQLNDTSANFTSQVLPNAIVWDKTTNAASGGEMYIVTAVSGPTLTLTPLGPVSAQGTGVPLGATYSIYMPEYTVRQYGQASATTANFLEDTSGVDFIAAGVKVGDSATKLGVADDIFVNNDYFLISAIGPDDFDKLLRSVDVSLIENNAVAANNSRVDFTYSSVNASVADAVYAYSDTGAAGNEDMRNALQDAVVASLETPWSEVAYDFPGLLNPAGGANLTWLGGRNFFFLAISS